MRLHNPLENFAPDRRFPTDAQPRNYQGESELQVSVHEKANAPNADVYHSDTIHPTDGPPIVRKDGVVLSGNGREQGAEEAVNLGNWESVRKDLLDKARRFGINPDEIAKHKNPILVRVMDATVTDPTELARYGIEMNRDAGQGMSATEQSAALSRMLTPKIVERMANVFRSVSGDSSLRDAMRARSKDLAEILTDAGLVDPKKRSAYFTDDGELTESAKMLIENTLAGVTVSNPAVLDSASDSVKSKLGRVGMDFILMRAAGSNWNLASYNTDAVSSEQAEDASTYLRNMEGPGTQGDEKEGTYSLVERRLHPERFRLSNLEMAFDGEPTDPPVHPVVEALAMALEKSPRAYANLIGDYAEAAAKGGMTLYGAMNPADVFNEYVAGKFGLNIIPDQWVWLNGLPDSVKAELEDTCGPLPVEPAANHERVAKMFNRTPPQSMMLRRETVLARCASSATRWPTIQISPRSRLKPSQRRSRRFCHGPSASHLKTFSRTAGSLFALAEKKARIAATRSSSTKRTRPSTYSTRPIRLQSCTRCSTSSVDTSSRKIRLH